MDIDTDDIDAVFRLRHETKVATDASSALAKLDELRARLGDTAALAFNRGLCLYELGDLAAAHAAFRAAIASPDAPSKLGAFSVDGAELALKTTDGPIPPDIEQSILHVARYFNVDQRDRFLTYLLSRDRHRGSFDLFWAILDASPLPAFKSPPTDGVARLLFARCSSHGAEEKFRASLADPKLAALRESDDGALIALLHGDDIDPDRWLASLREITERTALDGRDSTDLALVAMGTLDDETARPVVETLAARSGQPWGVLRVLGIMAERSGDRIAALGAYDRAARAELEVRGFDVPSAAPAAARRVSCIALSFNDGPLVWHFCRMIAAHCDELVVNDGGSSDDTVAEFRRFASQTGFPVHVIEDVQHRNRERTVFCRQGYRDRNLGGVLGFEADRRRTTTLVQAEGDYVLMLDLDDYLPPFPNMKTLVEASPYVDHFAGARLDVIGGGRYTALHVGAAEPRPTLYRRHPKHVYGGTGGDGEYLARLDVGIAKWATAEPHACATECFSVWHLKHVLDPRSLSSVRPGLGPSYPMRSRCDRPLASALPSSTRW